MKYYILLLGLFLLGCNNQRSEQDTESSQNQDTIEQIKITGDYELLFQELSSQTYIQEKDFAKLNPDEYEITNAVYGLSSLTDNPDTLNVIIEYWLDKYYERKSIIKEANTIKEYEQRSSIINKLIDITQPEEYQDIIYYYRTTSIYKNYLCNYYSDRLVKLPKDGKLQNAIEKEMDAWNRFYDSQAETLRVFISDIGSGVTRGSTFLNFKSAFYSTMQESILDLYWALTNDNYEIAKRFIPIGQMYFEKEYQLTSNLMQDSTMFSNNYYSFDQRINIVQQEKEAWYGLMESREQVSQHLKNHIKSVYDNATYRLQKQQLIELKNEFEGYKGVSLEYSEFLLTEDHNHKKLLDSKRPREVFRKHYRFY